MKRIKRDEFEKKISLCLEAGDTVMVHSSLSKIGYFEFGIQGIIDILENIIGPNGHLVMLSATYSFSNTGIFDYNNSKAETGSLVETFRKNINVLRSQVPMASFVSKSEQFTKRYNSYLDKSSPMMELLKNNAKILLIGVDYNKCTTFHLAEERLKVKYNKYIEFSGKMIKDSIEEHISQRYYVRKDLSLMKDVTHVGQHMERDKLVKKIKIGDGYIRCFEMKVFDTYCTNELNKDINSFIKKKI